MVNLSAVQYITTKSKPHEERRMDGWMAWMDLSFLYVNRTLTILMQAAENYYRIGCKGESHHACIH